MHRWRGADEVSPSLLHPLLVVVSVEVERLLFPLGLSQFDLFLDDARELFRVDAIVEIQSDGGRSSEDDAQQYPKDEDGGNSDHGCASRCPEFRLHEGPGVGALLGQLARIRSPHGGDCPDAGQLEGLQVLRHGACVPPVRLGTRARVRRIGRG